MWERLTPREHDVAELLIQAYSNREIGKALGVQTNCIKQYINNMFRKYAITDGCKRVKLVVLLYRESHV